MQTAFLSGIHREKMGWPFLNRVRYTITVPLFPRFYAKSPLQKPRIEQHFTEGEYISRYFRGTTSVYRGLTAYGLTGYESRS